MMMKEHIVDTYGEIKYTRGQRLLGRLDPAEHRRLDLPRPARRHPAELRLPRFDHHGLEVGDCVLLVNFYAGGGVDGVDGRADPSADQRQEDRDQTATSTTDGCHGWNNSFGFNNKPGNYARTLVIRQHHRRSWPLWSSRATTACCPPLRSTTR